MWHQGVTVSMVATHEESGFEWTAKVSVDNSPDMVRLGQYVFSLLPPTDEPPGAAGSLGAGHFSSVGTYVYRWRCVELPLPSKEFTVTVSRSSLICAIAAAPLEKLEVKVCGLLVYITLVRLSVCCRCCLRRPRSFRSRAPAPTRPSGCTPRKSGCGCTALSRDSWQHKPKGRRMTKATTSKKKKTATAKKKTA